MIFPCLFVGGPWLTNNAMSSLMRMIFAGAAGLSLALLAGCKTSQPQPPAPAAPPVAITNEPVTPTNQPLQPAVSLPPDSGDNMAANILAWDSVTKEYHAKPGETNAPFSFALTNVSKGPVVIYDTATTCDCTVASLPSKPWTIPSGGTGQIDASINLTKKFPGVVTNAIIVFTSQGNRRLYVKAYVPERKP